MPANQSDGINKLNTKGISMNENAKKWIAALRSGEFKQGKNLLLDAAGNYCCLGVACELFIRDGGQLEKGLVKRMGENILISFDDGISVSPATVKDWLGLNSDDGGFVSGGRKKSLVLANDHGETFDEIANIIESEPRGLFK